MNAYNGKFEKLVEQLNNLTIVKKTINPKSKNNADKNKEDNENKEDDDMIDNMIDNMIDTQLNYCCFCGVNMGDECLSQYCSRQCLYNY